MLSQLHSKLRDNIQLPVCLRVISHLRRLRVYSETQLRVRYPTCFSFYFISLLTCIYIILRLLASSRVEMRG